MTEFRIKIRINRPMDVVWQAYIDPENMLYYTRFLEKVVSIKGKFGEIGSIAHLHYLEDGKSYIFEDKLIEYEEK
jgi:ligand-binding SRPBCC domain-containing protein